MYNGLPIFNNQINEDLIIFKELSNKIKKILFYPVNNISIRYNNLQFNNDFINRLEKLLGTKEIIIGYSDKKTKILLTDMMYPNGKYTIFKVIEELENYVQNTHDINMLIMLERIKYMFSIFVINNISKFSNSQALYRMITDINEDISMFLKTDAAKQVIKESIKKNIVNKNMVVREEHLGDYLSLIYLKCIESESIYSQFLEINNENNCIKR